MIKRIGLLTSGGDCQALNATMRGVVKALSNAVDDLEVYGFDLSLIHILRCRRIERCRSLWSPYN